MTDDTFPIPEDLRQGRVNDLWRVRAETATTYRYHNHFPGEYPDLELVMEMAEAHGFKPMRLESEIGGRDLVKAYLSLGDIMVAFTDPDSVEGEPDVREGLYWDYWDGVTSEPLGDGRGGFAPTPATALGALMSDLVQRRYATRVANPVYTALQIEERRAWRIEAGQDIDCDCGHPISEHQTGSGPWTGFCGQSDCDCEQPTVNGEERS
jgi:hypothetical protein